MSHVLDDLPRGGKKPLLRPGDEEAHIAALLGISGPAQSYAPWTGPLLAKALTNIDVQSAALKNRCITQL